ncbi:MAG: O-methyltransferase [Candidatus Acidiferrales bacterium]
MKPIVNADVEKYLHAMLPRRDKVLMEMEKLAKRNDIPIIGPAVGRLLYLLAKISGASRIFEMGSAIGYSTIWLARAAGPRGEVFYSDGSPENHQRARAFCRRAGVASRIHFGWGDAFELFDNTRGAFDLIFIDIDKHQYPEALRKAWPRLRRGGLLLADNTLWSGKVAHPPQDLKTRAIQEFNRRLYRDKKFFPVIVPLRDGLTVARKR